jgi:hypothetical protein
MPSPLFHLLSLWFLLLANASRRDKDVPEFVIIGKGLFPLHPYFFYNPHEIARIFLFKTVYTDDVIN